MLRFHHFSRWAYKPTPFVLQTNHLAPIQAHLRSFVFFRVICSIRMNKRRQPNHFSRWAYKPTPFVLQTNHLSPIQAKLRNLVSCLQPLHIRQLLHVFKAICSIRMNKVRVSVTPPLLQLSYISRTHSSFV